MAPAFKQRSDALWQRLICRHAALLQHPQLIRNIINDKLKPTTLKAEADWGAEIAAALKVRVLPGTSLVEVSLERDVAGKPAGLVATWLVEQYVADEKTAKEERVRQQVAALRNYVQRDEFRLEELSREESDVARNKSATQPARSASDADARARAAHRRNTLRQLQRSLDHLAEREMKLDEDRHEVELQIIREPKVGE